MANELISTCAEINSAPTPSDIVEFTILPNRADVDAARHGWKSDASLLLFKIIIASCNDDTNIICLKAIN